jgi:crotonobetainyl-CoA:carnitine CoA-transferase CaiB-like acyl-CoA transferase
MGGHGLVEDVATGKLTDLAHHDREIRASVAPWFAERKKWELTREAQSLRLHWGASATIADLVVDPHVRETGALEPAGEAVGREIALPRLALRPVEFEPGVAPPPSRRPLRVLDLTHYWAGPSCARMLADFGMDVIKIEPPGKPDPVRLQIPRDNEPGPFPLERGWWNGLNVGKRSLSLDIRSEHGRAAFLALVANSDVLVENFSATAMEHWGLTWDTIRAANPNIVSVSMSAFGSRGPYRSYIAFGSNLEPLAGIPELVGDPAGRPALVASVTPDTFVALVGAASVLTALLARQQGGAGTWIDISQHQALPGLIAWAFDEYQVTGKVPSRTSIHPDGHAFRAVLRCAGDDNWLVVSIKEGAMLKAVLAGIGAPRGSPAQEALERWASTRDNDEAARWLRRQGVAAMPVLDVAATLQHEQFAARGTLRQFTTAAGFPARGIAVPFSVDGVRARCSPQTPRFGSSTRAVLAEIGGLTGAEIDALIAEGAAAEDFVVEWAPTQLPIDEWVAIGAVRRLTPAERGGAPAPA